MNKKHFIAITLGDPAGIGPEISLKACHDKVILELCCPVLIGDKGLLKQQADSLGIPFDFFSPSKINKDNPTSKPVIIDFPNITESVEPGHANSTLGKASGQYLEKALELALEGSIAAVVTGPINKETFNQGGYKYAGQTEFFAKKTNTNEYAMMFVYGNFRIVLLSTHMSLIQAIQKVTKANIIGAVNLIEREMWKFGVNEARIGVAGLNPHSSEGSLFGDEEDREIIPAIKECQRKGLHIEGPFPADSLFAERVRNKFNVILALYHDQGLIPMKMASPKGAVNVTLGLPIIRTSVDHGTAYDIAGKGFADPSSLKEAIKLAVKIAENVEKGKQNLS